MSTSCHFFVDSQLSCLILPVSGISIYTVSGLLALCKCQVFVLYSYYKCTIIISPRHLENDSIMCSANGLSFNQFVFILLGKSLGRMASEKWKIRSVDAGAVLCVVCVFSVGREMRHSLRMDSTCTTGNTVRCCSAAFGADRCARTHAHTIISYWLNYFSPYRVCSCKMFVCLLGSGDCEPDRALADRVWAEGRFHPVSSLLRSPSPR